MAVTNPRSRRLIWIGVGVFVVVAVAVGVGVGVGVSQSNSNGNASSAGSSPASPSSSGSSGSPTAGSFATSGTDGSELTLDSGDVVTYSNSFGGDWQFDIGDFGDGGSFKGGRAQDWSPRIGDEWVWGRDIARGVNLGGWLVLEPFISPGIFEEWREKTPAGGIDIIDEYTLCQAMGDEKEAALTAHYETFITEQDFVEIAAAGLNFVRIPIGFWAVETMDDEPFLERVSWTYFLKAIKWARKYGLRVNLDLHAIPGSQNGWNHSGKDGEVNFMASVMGIANAERTLSILRTLAQFASRPENADVIPLMSIVNEYLNSAITREAIESFYLEAYRTVRTSTGLSKGPMMVIIDGFSGPAAWYGFAAGADRIVLDQHPYIPFDPALYTLPTSEKSTRGCLWAGATNTSSARTGVTISGEFSGALTDCAYWLNGVGPNGTATSVLSDDICNQWRDWRVWTDEQKQQVKTLVLDEMDALQSFFFWTWKIGESRVLGYASAAEWHYQLGLKEGWIPADPREANGRCAAKTDPVPISFDGNYPAYATGGGDGQVVASQTESRPWPPLSLLSIETPASVLPRYTATGTMVTLPAATYTQGSTTVTVGSGWTNAEDSQGAFVPISGCEYPDKYNAGFSVPAAAATCTGGSPGARRRAAAPSPRRLSGPAAPRPTPHRR